MTTARREPLRFAGLAVLQLIAIGLLFTSLLGSIGSSEDQNGENGAGNVDAHAGHHPPPHAAAADHDRLVLFLVDALRADMVAVRPEMRRVRGMLKSGLAKGYLTRAHSPTVTMPRLKALMSGNVPQFLDLVRNLADSSSSSTISSTDSLIGCLKAKGKRLVLHGDDTWLKLYKGAFAERSDPTTSSFFTPDFVEVDFNVSRHIPEDLDPKSSHPHSKDWDVLVLHYLGVDHVGHQLGPDSNRMSEKLTEMDNALWNVLQNIQQQDQARGTKTLALLLSDHGMNGAGNHGGSSPPETSAVGIFFQSPVGSFPGDDEPDVKGEVPLDEALQVDIAPSLSVALGVQIPSRSIGCPLEGAFRAQASFGEANEMAIQHILKRKSAKGIDYGLHDARACHRIQRELLAKSLARSGGLSASDMAGQSFAIVLLLGVVAYQGNVIRELSPVDAGALAAQLLGSISSSAIENEHATMYFTLTSCLVVLSLRARMSKPNSKKKNVGPLALLVALICTRVMRSRLEIINFAKLAGLNPREFLNDGTPLLPLPLLLGGDSLSPILASIALTTFAIVPTSQWKNSKMARGTVILGAALAFVYNAIVDQPFIARIASYAILTGIIASLSRKEQNAIPALITFACLFVRVNLLPLVFLGLCLLSCIELLEERERTTLAWVAGWALFYAMGNSHSVATIDISGGYIGSSEYSRERVALITAVVVYFGPLLACASALKAAPTDHERSSVLQTLFFFQSARLAMASVVTVAMQNHLFIWSVFAPRWGYEIVWTLVFDLFIVLSSAMRTATAKDVEWW